MSLRSRLALVTGSTSGIGLGVARSLAGQGANIILNGFGKSSEIEELVKELTDKYKVFVDYDGADLGKADQIEQMIKKKRSDFKGIDILVNNAGIQHVSPIENFPNDKWQSIIDINLSGVFYAMKHAIPHMKEQNWGRIINVASVHGYVGSVGKSAYVASKHGVIGLTKVTALELATTGVTANCICPGWVLTPLVQKQIEDRAKAKNVSVEKESVDLLSEKQPSQKFVTPDQLGALASFLASDAASEVRGAAWTMDGGWTSQ